MRLYKFFIVWKYKINTLNMDMDGGRGHSDKHALHKE